MMNIVKILKIMGGETMISVNEKKRNVLKKVGVLLLFVLVIGMTITGCNKKIIMPAVIGTDFEIAVNLLEGFNVSREEVFDDSVAYGKVVAANLIEGEEYKVNTEVVISTAKYSVMPEIVGLDIVEAKTLLGDFDVKVEYSFSGEHKDGIVKGASLEADNKYAPNSEVVLQVEENMELLNIVGKNGNTMKSELEEKGFVVAIEDLEKLQPGEELDLITGMSLMANRRYEMGTEIILTVVRQANISEVAIEFEDSNLEKAVKEALNYTGDSVTNYDMLDIYEIRIENDKISSLKGIEHCLNLSSLMIYRSSISDLTPLSGLENLFVLVIHGGSINDITPLESNTNIVCLELTRNNISDISPLTNLFNLESLDITENKVYDLSPLSELQMFSQLNITGNEVTDLTPIKDLNINWLKVEDNPIKDFSMLDSMDIEFLYFE